MRTLPTHMVHPHRAPWPVCPTDGVSVRNLDLRQQDLEYDLEWLREQRVIYRSEQRTARMAIVLLVG